jgi:DNA-binding CsgD family transcriptional regulator
VWLIKGPAQTASLAIPIKRILGAQRLVIFSTWESALRQSVKHSLPQLVFVEGTPQASQIAEIRSRFPGVPLLGVTAYDDVHATSSRASRAVLETPPPRDSKRDHVYRLTVRERQILPLMVRGFIKKEIADQLSLSFHTVNNHERSIYRKLGVNTRSAVVAKALMEGLM